MDKEESKLRISYSSGSEFQGCQRRYYYRKVVEIDPDPDVEEDTKALRIGKAFHAILEWCKHKRPLLNKNLIALSFKENEIVDNTDKGLILGMVFKYLDLHEKSELSVKGIEDEVGDREDFVGYIDATMADENGYWWIVDLKTAGRLSNSLLSRLAKDPQLNLYAYHREQIAKKLRLDLDKFAGVRYRVTTKCQLKCRKTETVAQFAQRVQDRVESYDIGIPAQDLNPSRVYSHFMKLLKQMRELPEMKEEDIPQNFSYCETYFKPCPYWSNCYGRTFTHAADQYSISDSETMAKVLVVNDDDDLLDDDFLEELDL